MCLSVCAPPFSSARNILLRAGSFDVKICDFGLARYISDAVDHQDLSGACGLLRPSLIRKLALQCWLRCLSSIKWTLFLHDIG